MNQEMKERIKDFLDNPENRKPFENSLEGIHMTLEGFHNLLQMFVENDYQEFQIKFIKTMSNRLYKIYGNVEVAKDKRWIDCMCSLSDYII